MFKDPEPEKRKDDDIRRLDVLIQIGLSIQSNTA